MRRTNSTIRLVACYSLVPALILAVMGCEFPCGPGAGKGPPFGLEVRNESAQDLDVVSLTLEDGETYDFGPIPRYGDAYRFIEVHGAKEAALKLEWANGKPEQKLFAFEIVGVAPIRIPLWPRRPEDTHKYSYYQLREAASGSPEGVTHFWVGNDTPEVIRTVLYLGDNEWQREIEPYEAESCHLLRPLVGRHQAELRLSYADGREFEVRADLDLKPKQRLVLIIKQHGEVVVWDDPTVNDASVVETVEVNTPGDHQE